MNEVLRSRALEKLQILIQSKNLFFSWNSESYCNLPVHINFSVFAVHFSPSAPTLSQNVCNKQNTQFLIYKHISFFNCYMFLPYWSSSWNHFRSRLNSVQPTNSQYISLKSFHIILSFKHGRSNFSLFFT